MPNTVADIALPQGAWTRLTPLGPAPSFAVQNRGAADIMVKWSAIAPTDAGGAIVVGPGRMLPPQDLAVWGLNAWALSVTRDGSAAVIALYP